MFSEKWRRHFRIWGYVATMIYLLALYFKISSIESNVRDIQSDVSAIQGDVSNIGDGTCTNDRLCP
jgi:hypothetical protein